MTLQDLMKMIEDNEQELEDEDEAVDDEESFDQEPIDKGDEKKDQGKVPELFSSSIEFAENGFETMLAQIG